VSSTFYPAHRAPVFTLKMLFFMPHSSTVNKLRTKSARGARGIEAEILFCREAAKKIRAESPVLGAGAPKTRTDFLALLTVPKTVSLCIYMRKN
jgi:hypothetical protein